MQKTNDLEIREQEHRSHERLGQHRETSLEGKHEPERNDLGWKTWKTGR